MVSQSSFLLEGSELQKIGETMPHFKSRTYFLGFRFLIWATIFLFLFDVKLNFLNASPPKPDSIFQEKLDKPLPEWMQQQIKKTISRFDHQLSRKYLDQIMQKADFGNLVRVKIIDGEYSFEANSQKAREHSVAQDWNRIFQILHNSGRLPSHLDIDFVVSCNDYYAGPCDEKALSDDVYIRQPNKNLTHRCEPIFVQADCEHYSYIILPSWTMLEPETALHSQQRLLKGSWIPWRQKKPILFFRGGDSDSIPEHWAQSPRVKLILLSLQFPDLINAAFALSTHFQPNPSLPLNQIIRDYVPLEQHSQYRYLIDLDGNCASNPRNLLYLLSSSVLFKTVTPSVSWFYPALVPYEHFIPVKPDLSDLMSQLEYAMSHDDECRIIAQNARQLGEDLWDSIDIYIYRLLEAYAQRQALYYFPSLQGDQNTYYRDLIKQYDLHHQRPADINEHLPTLRRYAAECSSAVELGIRNIVSSWGIFLGLAESQSAHKSYLGVDIGRPEEDRFKLAEKLTTENGIHFQFWEKNDMHIDIEETDLLMIDTLHTYAHLTYELETFSPKIRKYIIMHDTSETFEYRDCLSYQGDHSEYPAFINRTKKGLWTAVMDFLERHPEWKLHERYTNNNGLTVLKRDQSRSQ